ncbi:hypothetical protein K1719_016142 [Acacia pycnantha]|nr:hypothetical protein K1719_042520 [Acacia pycnantha]KAI9112825.1 hypothetical protein K1719_016142 [Acacia pycnantha]
MSIIPPESPWRGAAAAYAQPLDQAGLLKVQALVEHVYYMNCGPFGNPRLDDIIYRSSDDERDTRRHVFRWDISPYEHVFANGFKANCEDNTHETTFFNLYDYVHNASGRPLESTRPATHAFISTTIDSGWNPSPKNLKEGQSMLVYRYEINAPGGIWVSQTLGDLYQYPSLDQVCFISAIAPQYIRSAELYIVTRESGSRYPRCERADDKIMLNANFNPHSDNKLELWLPVVDYEDETFGRRELEKLITYTTPSDHGEDRRQVVSDDIVDWYANRVEDVESYVNAAFRAHSTNEAYLFIKNEYVLVNYAPGTTHDKIMNGPLLICDGFRSLAGTAFGEYGIDCAFDTDGTEAFIFCGKLCAYIDYAPGTTDGEILHGPITISSMFPFFKGTVFENGIDAAIRATASNEAYLFKGDQYAHINYSLKTKIAFHHINEGFHGLKGTIFESGIEAAFASHRKDEAYIFKQEKYAIINFSSLGSAAGVKKIVDYWPSLRPILPHKNRGLEEYDHPDQHNRDQDDL